jgi:acetylglutamate/LysW-gamma-L-alpha-aminoadipate kinase
MQSGEQSTINNQQSEIRNQPSTIVVKMGGAAGVNLEMIAADAAALVKQGRRVVLVHGGSDETNKLSEQLGRPPRFVTSPSGFTSRYTDRQTLEIFAMATAGKISTLLVEALQKKGVNALSLSGADGRLMVAKRKEAIRIVESGKVKMLRDDYTGTIQTVNAALLEMLLDAGFTPVIAPMAISSQETGESVALNVDADRAAAMIAGALKADSLVILTNVPGLMRNFPDESTLIPHLERAGLEVSLSFAEGRMKKKVLGASEALEHGVRQVIFADGRVAEPVQRALAGLGTVIN